MEEKVILTHSRQETYEFAKKLAQTVIPGKIVCLYGELGSGKTTFTQGFARGLGIEKKIISPTFVIIRTYSINLKSQISRHALASIRRSGAKRANLKTFYHIDLYRIESDRDVGMLGLDEIMNDKDAVVVIEWAEKLGTLLPKKRTDVYFEYMDENKRKIIINHK